MSKKASALSSQQINQTPFQTSNDHSKVMLGEIVLKCFTYPNCKFMINAPKTVELLHELLPLFRSLLGYIRASYEMPP